MTALAPSQAIVLRALEAAAERGDVCPTNGELGELIAAGAATAGGAVAALQKKGIITVRRFARSRQVTIVSSGHRTRHEVSKALHWRDAERARSTEGAA